MSKQKHKLLPKILRIFFWLVVGVGIILFAFRLITKAGFQAPLASYVVQSGSMEPSIMTGDIILIRPESIYEVNDVITFLDQKKRVVTHRVAEVKIAQGQTTFLTKGDANRSIDIEFVPLENVIGKVQLTIPKLGFLVSFAKTTPGIILFVIIPATIVIYDELSNVISAARQKRR